MRVTFKMSALALSCHIIILRLDIYWLKRCIHMSFLWSCSTKWTEITRNHRLYYARIWCRKTTATCSRRIYTQKSSFRYPKCSKINLRYRRPPRRYRTGNLLPCLKKSRLDLRSQCHIFFIEMNDDTSNENFWQYFPEKSLLRAYIRTSNSIFKVLNQKPSVYELRRDFKLILKIRALIGQRFQAR